MSETEDYPLPESPREEVNIASPGFKRGDSARGVFDLQLRLGCPATGVYDEMTEYAVKQMQAASGMTVDGIADSVLHGRLGLTFQP